MHEPSFKSRLTVFFFFSRTRVRRLVLRMHEPSIKARLTDFFFWFFLFFAIRACLNDRIVSIVSQNTHKYTRPMIKARLTDFFWFFLYLFLSRTRVSQLSYRKTPINTHPMKRFYFCYYPSVPPPNFLSPPLFFFNPLSLCMLIIISFITHTHTHITPRYILKHSATGEKGA